MSLLSKIELSKWWETWSLRTHWLINDVIIINIMFILFWSVILVTCDVVKSLITTVNGDTKIFPVSQFGRKQNCPSFLEPQSGIFVGDQISFWFVICTFYTWHVCSILQKHLSWQNCEKANKANHFIQIKILQWTGKWGLFVLNQCVKDCFDFLLKSYFQVALMLI